MRSCESGVIHKKGGMLVAVSDKVTVVKKCDMNINMFKMKAGVMVKSFLCNCSGAVLRSIGVNKLVDWLKCSPYQINRVVVKLVQLEIEIDDPALVISFIHCDFIKNEFWRYKLKSPYWGMKLKQPEVVKKCIVPSIFSELWSILIIRKDHWFGAINYQSSLISKFQIRNHKRQGCFKGNRM